MDGALGESSESYEIEPSSTNILSTGTDRTFPPTIAAVTAPWATYTVVDADTEYGPAVTVTVIVYVVSTDNL